MSVGALTTLLFLFLFLEFYMYIHFYIKFYNSIKPVKYSTLASIASVAVFKIYHVTDISFGEQTRTSPLFPQAIRLFLCMCLYSSFKSYFSHGNLVKDKYAKKILQTYCKMCHSISCKFKLLEIVGIFFCGIKSNLNLVGRIQFVSDSFLKR